FNGRLRDECLNGEIFYSLREAQIVIEQWRIEYNTRRPHSALGYRPPAPHTRRLPQLSTSAILDAISKLSLPLLQKSLWSRVRVYVKGPRGALAQRRVGLFWAAVVFDAFALIGRAIGR